jgi:hypothetical protein
VLLSDCEAIFFKKNVLYHVDTEEVRVRSLHEDMDNWKCHNALFIFCHSVKNKNGAKIGVLNKYGDLKPKILQEFETLGEL